MGAGCEIFDIGVYRDRDWFFKGGWEPVHTETFLKNSESQVTGDLVSKWCFLTFFKTGLRILPIIGMIIEDNGLMSQMACWKKIAGNV